MRKTWCSIIQFIVIICEVSGDVQICDIVHPPKSLEFISNCTLACVVRLKDLYSENGEVAVCEKNTSLPVTCVAKKDCTKYYASAYCDKIPCFCESEHGTQAFYLSKLFKKVAVSYVCIVSTEGKHPGLPLIPFPWQTLLVVCGILLLLAICLIALKWASPFLRAMQIKRVEQHSRNINFPDTVDNMRLFHSSHQQDSVRFHLRPEITQDMQLCVHAPTVRPTRQERYTASCHESETVPLSANSQLQEDLPPSYEVAVQETRCKDKENITSSTQQFQNCIDFVLKGRTQNN